MKRGLAVLALVFSCTAPAPSVVPKGSYDLQPPSNAPKSKVYWRDGQPASAPASAPAESTSSDASLNWSKDLASLPAGHPLRSLQQATLSNGLRVYAIEQRELPVFAAELAIPAAGSAQDKKKALGLPL